MEKQSKRDLALAIHHLMSNRNNSVTIVFADNSRREISGMATVFDITCLINALENYETSIILA